VGKADRKVTKKKKPFFQSLADRVSEAADLFGILVNRPKDFLPALLVLAKRFVRNIWDLRGGGLYAVGYVITLVWLEIQMLFQDLIDLTGGSSQFGEQLIQGVIKFVFRFAYESLINSIQAFAWPATAVQFYPPWGLGIMVALFAVFPKMIKPPLERWLFQDGEVRNQDR
jgi:hypothetical protein